MNEWPKRTLGDLVELQRGHDLPAQDRKPGSVPIIGSFGVTGTHDKAKYFGPGVAIGRSGASIGKATFVDEPYWPLNTCLFVKSFNGNEPRWIYRLLDGIDFAAFNSGSAQPSLNRNFLRNIPVSVPPPHEQRAIAEVLGALDDKIASNAKLAATAEELISVHFQRAIESEGTTPRSLFEAIDIDFGEPFKGSEFSDPGTGRPLIRIRDLKTFTSQVWTTENRSREILIQPGDVVVGMDAEFRPTSWLGEPGLLNQRVCRARGKSVGPAFVRETLRAPLRRIENSKSATTVIHLNKKDLEEAEVLMPASERLTLFETAVEALYSLRVSIAVENRSLAATRGALLPQLMSGQLRVKEAQKVLEVAGV
ncbi:restriction endonuclease subunit S [Arthrobacter sp. PsM3]|uniref:restriction endonuclease subunit S n=1 Tax=Arthrobacter sp. PsM3 TaxID=3030531 RepID=UPI00263B3967|nr:restriction endonuclease subunit S [Arthrobacter sp. PsM3]MDN4643430.1 restriction endonuclease subunit S [Arthrobacter sp. PsM3]